MVSPELTSTSFACRKHRDRVVRHGLGMMIESEHVPSIEPGIKSIVLVVAHMRPTMRAASTPPTLAASTLSRSSFRFATGVPLPLHIVNVHGTDGPFVVRSVQETCNFDVLYAYLSCGNYDFR